MCGHFYRMTEVVYDNTRPLPLKYLHPLLQQEIFGWKDSMINNIDSFGGQCEMDPMAIPSYMIDSFMYYVMLMNYVLMDRGCRAALIMEDSEYTTAEHVTQAQEVWKFVMQQDYEMKKMEDYSDDIREVMHWNARTIASISKLHKETSIMKFLNVSGNIVAMGWGVFVLLAERQPTLPPQPNDLAVSCTSCITEQIEQQWREGGHSFYERALIPLHHDDWKKDRNKRSRSREEGILHYQQDQETWDELCI